MVGKIRSLTLVLRHRWEKDRSISNYDVWDLRKRYKLGVWCTSNIALRGPGKHCKVYMIGVNLIVATVWISFSFSKILTFKIKQDDNSRTKG